MGWRTNSTASRYAFRNMGPRRQKSRASGLQSTFTSSSSRRTTRSTCGRPLYRILSRGVGSSTPRYNVMEQLLSFRCEPGAYVRSCWLYARGARGGLLGGHERRDDSWCDTLGVQPHGCYMLKHCILDVLSKLLGQSGPVHGGNDTKSDCGTYTVRIDPHLESTKNWSQVA